MQSFLWVLIVTLAAVALCGESLELVRVATTNGEVIGYKYNAFDLHDPLYHGLANVFKGIPFARPPVGDLRLRRPEPADSWSMPLDATFFRPGCPQNPNPAFHYEEDCLYLNVFMPVDMSPTQAYPVMVWIYGGGFVAGSADFYPTPGIVTNFVSRGVVVVTINYRLGLLGQFTTLTEGFPANLALLDQVLALRWVQREIGNFGGNPQSVTIFGESAGGCSVSMHTFSPYSVGLFHRAIVESGPALLCMDGAHIFTHASQRAAETFCGISPASWHMKNFTESELRTCLLSYSADDFVRNGGFWAPTIDGPGGFMPDWPRNLRRTNVPIIIGTNRDELFLEIYGGMVQNHTGLNDFTRATYLSYRDSSASSEEFGQYTMAVRSAIDQAYRQPSSPDDHLAWMKLASRVLTDHFYHAMTLRQAQMWPLDENQNVYLYSFEFASPALSAFKFGGYDFIPHTLELLYTFRFGGYFNRTALGPTELKVMDNFGTWWTNFAKFGNPTPEGSAISWLPLSSDRADRYLQIVAEPSMRDDYHLNGTHFWNDVVPSITHSVGPTFPPTSPPLPTTTTSAAARHYNGLSSFYSILGFLISALLYFGAI